MTERSLWLPGLALAVCLLVAAPVAYSGKTAASTSSYEAVIAELEQGEACEGSHRRDHGSHKKCCFRTWPADPGAAEALGLMVVYPTPTDSEEAATFGQARGVYQLGADGLWQERLRPGPGSLTLIRAGEPELHIRYDGPAHTTAVTHEVRPDAATSQKVKSYVGDCSGHGPWWWEGRSMEAVLGRLAADGALPIRCPEGEGPYGESSGDGGFREGFRRGDGAVVLCSEPDSGLVEQALRVDVRGGLGSLTPSRLVFPDAWGCARSGTPHGEFLIPRSTQSYSIAQGLPVGTIETTDGVTVQWPTWAPAIRDGSPKPSPLGAQGVVTITDPDGRAEVDVRLGVAEDGSLSMQGHGRYRRYGPGGALEVSGHFFDGTRDGTWVRTASDGTASSEVHGSSAHPEGRWAYLYAAQPIGCTEALRQMQRHAAPVSSAAYADRLLARIDSAQARLQREAAAMERGGTDAAERRFIGCAGGLLTELTTFGNELRRARESGQAPTGACRGWLDGAMGALAGLDEECAAWAGSALGAGLFSSARSYLSAQERYQELSCRCERIGDEAAAEAWLQEVGDRAADRWPSAP